MPAAAAVEIAVLYHASASASVKLLEVDQLATRYSSVIRRKKMVATSARVMLFMGRTVPSG